MTIETELPAVKVKAAIPERIWLYRPFRELSSELCGASDIWYAEEDLGDHDIQDGVKYEYVLKDDPGNGADRIAATRAAALEEAAKLIQATADEYSTKGRDLRGGYSDRRFYAVMGARLNESAAAIRSLIPEKEEV
jgi:hypothetical protein